MAMCPDLLHLTPRFTHFTTAISADWAVFLSYYKTVTRACNRLHVAVSYLSLSFSSS
jgi:argininosuccinate lyase